LKLSASAIGFAFMVSGFAGFLATYPAGWLADTFGRKWVVVPANLATAASMVLFGWSASFATFLAACTVWSIASSVGGSAPSAYAVDCAPPGMNAAAVSCFRMIADAGYVVGPIALGLIADAYGAAAALDATAVALALTAVAFALRAPETLPLPNAAS
jgi:MFS family permease